MNKKKNISFVLVLVFIAIVCAVRLFWSYQIGKNSVFVVAKVYKVTNSGKNGPYYHCYYNYKGKRFEFSLTSKVYGLNDNGLVFVEIDTFHIGRSLPLEFTKVPDCIKISDVPFNGWKDLPKCK